MKSTSSNATLPDARPLREPSNILEVENLSVTLDGKKILRDVSFVLKKGEGLAVVGPNGAGKTVLFHALLGSAPYTGEIRWGKDTGIGYVPQRFAFDRNVPITVREFFLLKAPRFWFPPRGFMQHVSHELSVSGLTRSILTRQLSELSGGEVQRVLISWAMVGHPDVLLFDEPTAGIDIGAEETIYDIIGRLRRQRHTSVILISHDLQIVSEHADRVLCLNKEVIGYGSPEEVLSPKGLAKLYGSRDAARRPES
jgi:zinc transport system ATP-binding protein